MSKFLLMFPIVLFLLISGCNKDSESSDGNPTAPGNHAPVIQSTTATPSTISSGTAWEIEDYAALSCVATDQDGDTLTYTWSCRMGVFYEGISNGATAHWWCGTTGDYFINAIASDGRSIAKDSVKVTVQ